MKVVELAQRFADAGGVGAIVIAVMLAACWRGK